MKAIVLLSIGHGKTRSTSRVGRSSRAASTRLAGASGSVDIDVKTVRACLVSAGWPSICHPIRDIASGL